MGYENENEDLRDPRQGDQSRRKQGPSFEGFIANDEGSAQDAETDPQDRNMKDNEGR